MGVGGVGGTLGASASQIRDLWNTWVYSFIHLPQNQMHFKFIDTYIILSSLPHMGWFGVGKVTATCWNRISPPPKEKILYETLEGEKHSQSLR